MDFTFHEGTNGSDPWVEFYPYTPSATAGYAFTAIFGIATLVHLAMMFPYRAAFFLPLVLGTICETFGYYGRAWSHDDRTAIGPWALQQILLLCAPPFIAASIYMALSRIILALDASHLSSIRPKRLTTIFVLNDAICFLTQIAGAGVQVTGDARVMAIGAKAVLGGLVFALVVFCWFLWVAARFHWRLGRETTGVVMGLRCVWRRYMWAMYVSCLALMVRNLVRTVQFGSGKEAVVNTREAFIYVFDAALMLVAVGVLMVWHPGRLVLLARRVSKANQLCGQMEARDSTDIPLARREV